MPTEYNPEDEEPKGWPTLPTPLWNHMAMAIESVPSDHMFFFGGQKSPREFSNAVNVMECNTDETGMLTLSWESKWSLCGAPPASREDAGCAYDTTTCDLVFFGGWRQRWWSDTAILNVAGVVGPAYAVMDAQPATGPLTGGTPIVLKGLRFKESPMVTVRFTDGKREATVSGQWVSETELKCKSPDFSKFGAIDVVVRVSIGGEPYTVNETFYSYYANTSSKKCMCFGPGLRNGNAAGNEISFMMQAKDTGGKCRTTGDDPIDVKIDGPSAALIETPRIVDLQNGTYMISYYVPAAGVYSVTVGVDENPYDDEIIFTNIRGFPVELKFEGQWKSLDVSGSPAKLKPYTRFWSDGDKVYCFVKDVAKDEGVPDLPSDLKLGFEKPKPKKKPVVVEEGEEGAEGGGEEGAEAAEGGEEEAAEEEEEAEEEPEPEPEAEPEAAAPAEAEAPAAEAAAEAAPPMCYSLDPKTGAWVGSLLSDSEVKEPNFITIREAKMAALDKMGVPAKLVRAMQRPKTMLEDWSIEGVGGKPPSARGGWLHEIVRDKLWVYGGWEGEGKNLSYLDDLYCLDM